MKYNDLLLQLHKVVKEVKLKDNANYKFSDLFVNLYNLLYLEKVCDDYLMRLDDLNGDELSNFNGFASLDKKERQKLIEGYKKAYEEGLIDKRLLKEYHNISDYVAAIFLNELKDDFFSILFSKEFNKMIKNTYIEDDTLLNIFKMQSVNYDNISKGKDNLGVLFRNVMKEFELLTIIYNKNKLNGVISLKFYDTYLYLTSCNDKIIELENAISKMPYKFYQLKRYFDDGLLNSYETKDNLASLFLQLQNSKNWFKNDYLNLILNLTDENSFLFKTFFKLDSQYIMGMFLNYLKDKDFLNAVTEEKDGKVVFRKMDKLFERLSKYKLTDSKKLSDGNIINTHIKIKEIFDAVKDGEIVLNKNTDAKKL